MSILALDYAMFMRNSKTRLGLSLSQEAIIFKLAFRVGSNTSTWVSHESLAKECGIHPQNLTAPMKKIVATDIIRSKQNTHDKRKRIYLFSDLIKNYSQMNDQQKMEVHLAFGDEYQYREAVIKKNKKPVGNSESSSGKPELSSESSSGKPEEDTSGKPEILYESENVAAVAPQGIQPFSKNPKEKRERNNKKQRELGGSPILQTFPDEFFPDDKRREILTEHSIRTNNAEHELLSKFESISKKYKTKSQDWQLTFEEFLIRELPKRTFEDSKGQKKRYDGNSINY